MARVRKFWSALFYAAAILAPATGQAAVTAREIQVAGRILALTANPPSGDVTVGIVYNPENAASVQDERDLLSILGSGLSVGDVNLIPFPVAISNISTLRTDIMFLTQGLGAGAEKAGDQASRQKILCITTDLTATQAGYCSVCLQLDTKVHITINQATLAASDVSFTEAFMLMVNEI